VHHSSVRQALAQNGQLTVDKCVGEDDREPPARPRRPITTTLTLTTIMITTMITTTITQMISDRMRRPRRQNNPNEGRGIHHARREGR
jgi:hypothetical protein